MAQRTMTAPMEFRALSDAFFLNKHHQYHGTHLPKMGGYYHPGNIHPVPSSVANQHVVYNQSPAFRVIPKLRY